MRKIFIFVLILSVFLSSMTPLGVSAKGADVENTEYEASVNCLDALGIMMYEEHGNFVPQINLTRAEVCSVIANIMELNTAEFKGIFRDVSEEMKYSGAIEAVYSYGIVSGDENGCFLPGNYISYNEAIKIMVTLLGRKSFAEANGGYPYGYLTVAGDLEISKDVDSGNFTKGEFAKLVYNCLDVEVADVYSVTPDSVFIKNSGAKTLLATYKGIDVIEGVITENKYTSLEKPGGKDKHVKINDMYLLSGETGIDEFIGYDVEAYYDIEKESIVYFRPLDENSVITVSAENSLGYENGVFSYDNGKGKTAKRNISGGAYIIYNNYAVTEFSGSLFDIKDDGKIVFVDNNSDGRDDVVIIYDYGTYIVNDYDSDSETLYLKNAVSIDLSKKEYDLLNDKNEKITGDYIKEWSVVSVMISQDGKNASVCSVSDNRISGKIDSLSSEGEIEIDGVKYKTTAGFKDNYTVKPGEEYLFLLSISGKIAGVKENENKTEKIGYVAAYGYDGGLDSKLKLKVLKDGKEKFLIAETTDKISADGDRLSQDGLHDRLSSLETAGEHLIIRYTLNEDGKINWIDTLYLGESENKDDALMESFVPESGLKWYSNHFMTSVIFNTEAPVLFIPTGLPDDSGIVPEENKKTDINYGYRTLSSFQNERAYSDFIAYKVGINTIESCAAIRNVSDVGGSGTYDTYMVVTIVDEISEVLDEDGNPAAYFKGYTNNSRVEAMEAESGLLDGLGSGDIVKLSFDNDKRINAYIKLFDASDKKVANQIEGEMYNSADAYHAARSVFGNLYQYDNGKLLITKYNPEELETLAVEKLNLEGKPLTETNIRNKIVGMCEVHEIGDFNRGYYVYDENNRGPKVSSAKNSDMKDYVNYGNDYVKVYTYSIYSSDRAVVIYK